MKNPRGVRATQRRDFSGSRSREWIDNEVVGCEFEDVRHRKRLRHLLEQFSGRVGSTTPWVSEDWANTKAAYRFFANERISEANIWLVILDPPGSDSRRARHRNMYAAEHEFEMLRAKFCTSVRPCQVEIGKKIFRMGPISKKRRHFQADTRGRAPIFGPSSGLSR